MAYYSTSICECGLRLTLSRLVGTGGSCPDCQKVYFTVEVDENAPPVEPAPPEDDTDFHTCHGDHGWMGWI